MSVRTIDLDETAYARLVDLATRRGVGIDEVVIQLLDRTSVTPTNRADPAKDWRAFFEATDDLDAGPSRAERE